jgi:phage shock protein PspC (stress-responsive transcriptional regulator)
MERVVTVNLNGNPYQLEEPAYDALRAYLSRAEAALADNPDKGEIIRDLEQSIADKCAGYLGPHKSVVADAEMTRVLDEMGPVEGEGRAEQASDHNGSAPREEPARPLRRLYRIYDRHAWTGVSAGLAAYAGIDVAWVRVLWILSALFSGGFTILLYLILIFAVPVAMTNEELAAAHGAPFNAQEVIDRAKREYGRFAEESGRGWRAQMRAQRRAWREQMRSWRHSWGDWDYGAGPAAPPAKPVGYATRVLAGLFAFIFSIITAALLIAFLIALFSLLDSGTILGWSPPEEVPGWLAIVVLAIAYAAISAPFSAMRRTSYATLSSGHRYGGHAADGFVTLLVIGAAAWFAWMFIPAAREMMEQAYFFIRSFASHWTGTWNWN